MTNSISQSNLTIANETININGKSIQKIYGGFGNNQPCILAKQIAEIHGYEVKEINRAINNNLDFFENGIDYINLMNEKNSEVECNHQQLLEQFYSQEALNRSKNIYLLSQQGYALLCGFLKTDEAKKIRKQMVREYFVLKSKPKNVLKITKDYRTLLKAFKESGFKTDVAVNKTITAMKEIYGEECLDVLEITPKKIKKIAKNDRTVYFSTKEIAKEINNEVQNYIEVRMLNKYLVEQGYQEIYFTGSGRRYKATEKGKLFSNNSSAGKLRWKKEIINIIKDDFVK